MGKFEKTVVLAKIQNEKLTVLTLPQNGVEVEVNMNTSWEDLTALQTIYKGQSKDEITEDGDAGIRMLEGLVKDWNLTKEDGKPEPITFDNIRKIGGFNLVALVKVIESQMGEAKIKKKTS